MVFPIARAREIAERHMTSMCRVLRPQTEIVSGQLVETGEPEAVYEGPCRLRSPNGSEKVVADQVARVVTGTLLTPFGTKVRGDDRPEVDGLAYEVVAVLPRSADLAAQEKCLVVASGEGA